VNLPKRSVLDKSFAKPYQEERAFPTRFRKEDTILIWRLSYIGFDSLAQAVERFDCAMGIPTHSKEYDKYNRDSERANFCFKSTNIYQTHNGVGKILHGFTDGNPRFRPRNFFSVKVLRVDLEAGFKRLLFC
jgi:hypothetical protein